MKKEKVNWKQFSREGVIVIVAYILSNSVKNLGDGVLGTLAGIFGIIFVFWMIMLQNMEIVNVRRRKNE